MGLLRINRLRLSDVVRDSNSGHQLLLPPANWCPMFAFRTTQHRTVLEASPGRWLQPSEAQGPCPRRPADAGSSWALG